MTDEELLVLFHKDGFVCVKMRTLIVSLMFRMWNRPYCEAFFYLCLFDTGIKLEEFTKAMTCKLAVQDEDDLIRQTFLVFDSRCKCQH